MNTSTDYRSIAKTDFVQMKRSAVAELEDRLVMVICDPELTAARIELLMEHKEANSSDQSNSLDPERFDATIRSLHLHGVLPALDEGHITLDELIAVVNDPDALKRAHLAVLNDPIDDDNGQADLDDVDYEPILDRCFDIASLAKDEFISLAKSHRWIPRIMEFSEKLGAATSDLPPDASGELIYSQYQNRININATIDEIPHGLCRLVVVETAKSANTSRITLLPVLMAKWNRWIWDRNIDDIFGRPMGKVTVRCILVVADDTNRRDFNSDEVHQFVRQLPDGPQKQKASQYLFGASRK
jgi:hypothetical protein